MNVNYLAEVIMQNERLCYKYKGMEWEWINGIMVGGKCTMILCSIAKKIQNLKIQIIPERLKAK